MSICLNYEYFLVREINNPDAGYRGVKVSVRITSLTIINIFSFNVQAAFFFGCCGLRLSALIVQ